MGFIGYRSRVLACLWGLLTVAAVQPAAADTLTLAWDPSTDTTVAGYAVYVSTSATAQGTAYDAGRTTSFSWPNAVAGQQYYFCVAAYWTGPVLGPCSAKIARYPNQAPTLNDPSSQSTIVGTSVSLRLVGTDPEGATLTYGASNLPPGLQLTPSTGMITGTPTTVGSYAVTATVSDGSLADAKTFTWNITSTSSSSSGEGSGSGSTETPPPPSGSEETIPPPSEGGSTEEGPSGSTGGETERRDTTPPVLTITLPTTSGKYTTEQSFINIGGTAIDNVGTKGVKWKTDRGRTGTATGTQSWLAAVPLIKGQNTITVTAWDEAGNVSTKILYVKVAPRFFR